MSMGLERKKVVIDRAIWNTGERYAEPQLVTEMRERYEHCNCCLAFLGIACNVPADIMIDVALPFDLRYDSLGFRWPPKLFEKSPHKLGGETRDRWDQVLAAINDADGVDDETREDWIRSGFEILFNFDVEFTGQYGEYQTQREDYSEDYWDEDAEGDRYGH